jgi:hypothetical protein
LLFIAENFGLENGQAAGPRKSNDKATPSPVSHPGFFIDRHPAGRKGNGS